MLETPVENPLPVINAVELPEYARAFCDKWGNMRKTPLKTVEQCKAGDFVKICLYDAPTGLCDAPVGFYYAFQVKLRRLVYQKEANVIKDTPEKSLEAALIAARRELVSIVNNYSKKLVELYLTFDKICYNQPELF
jgi:hypothetical protein